MWSRVKSSVAAIYLLVELGRTYPVRSVIVVACLIAAGLVEGVSVVALIPLLSILFGDTRNESDRVYQVTKSAFDFVGLPLSLAVLLGLIVVAVSLKATLKFSAMTYVGFTVSHMTAKLREQLLNALLHAAWPFFTRRPVGTFANAISTEAGRATSAFSAAYSALSTFIQVTIYLGAAFFVAWRISLLAIVVGVALMLVFSPTVVRSRQAGKRISEHSSGLVARLTDILIGLKALKAMAIEDRIGRTVARETDGLESAQRQQVIYKWLLSAGGEPVIVVIMAIGLYLAVVVGQQSPSTVTVIALMFYRTLNGFNQLQGLLQLVASYESGYWTLQKVISEADAAKEYRTGGAQPALQSAIEFRGVSFSYGERVILDNATFSIPAVGLTTIVGPSGSGKTTAIDLLIGLHVPERGDILLDGVPLNTLDQQRWREMIGYVPQESILLNDTVKANVALGRDGIGDAEVEIALRQAGAWSFVSSLPLSLQTQVGERGQLFSGGQRQRLAIARALVCKPAILILDEALSALDPENERAMCETIRQLARFLPVVAISHQSRIVDLADRVLTVQGGTLVEIPKPA